MSRITGAHSIIYSRDPEADRAFFQEILQFPYVDVGHGWLIFGLPPSEAAIHPSDENSIHELFLMTDDIQAFVKEMKNKKIRCSAVQDQGYGIMTQLTLPGGGKIGVYQPRHARPPEVANSNTPSKKTPGKTKKKTKAKPGLKNK